MDPDKILFFGITASQFERWSLIILPTALILYMIFIIVNLAIKSKAGKYGTLWLFVGLGVGFIGFIAKVIMEYFMTRSM